MKRNKIYFIKRLCLLLFIILLIIWWIHRFLFIPVVEENEYEDMTYTIINKELSKRDLDGSRAISYNDNAYLNKYETFDELWSDTHKPDKQYTQSYYKHYWTKQAYEQMRLSIVWVDTSVEPRSICLYNGDMSIEYEPIEKEAGKYTYLIDNVSDYEEFIFYFDWINPQGIDFMEEEQSDYEEYQSRSEELLDFKNDIE